MRSTARFPSSSAPRTSARGSSKTRSAASPTASSPDPLLTGTPDRPTGGAATRLWRIAPGRYDSLSGEGARRFGGRWTSPGRGAVYLASQLPLAALEVLAHVDPDTLPLDLEAFAVDVPAELGDADAWAQWDDPAEDGAGRRELPVGWRDVAQPLACRAVGDAWLARPVERRAALLRVPTAVLPPWAEPAGAGVAAGSWCAVLDPNHPAARGVRVAERHAFSFDARLLRRV